MRIVTGSQMAELDRLTQEQYGLEGQLLMELAGRKVAETLRQRNCRQVAFLCGPGNNGGDGLVAARAWHDLGGQSCIFLLGGNLSEAAAVNLKRAGHWGLPIHPLEGGPPPWEPYDAMVDALFGTGLKRNLSPEVLPWIHSLPRERTLALDIPSGLDSATGLPRGGAVRAHTTLTFGLPKLGQLLQPGASYCGSLQIEPLGFPRALLEDSRWPGQWLTPPLAQLWLPQPSPRSHKRNRGKVLIVAGSPRYPGAAALAALGALHSGAGLVHVLTTPAAGSRLPLEAIPIPFAQSVFSSQDLEGLRSLLTQVDALCLGPGLDRQPATREALQQLLQQSQLPTILDADALSLLPTRLSPRCLLTPHQGELAQLLQTPLAQIAAEPLAQALRAARNWNCSLLLKGDPTLVTSAGGSFCLSNQGTSVLAQAGTGDVLSGICATLLAQGLDCLEAGALAAYLHGLAGRLSGHGAGLRASQLASWLPQALTLTSRAEQDTSIFLPFSKSGGPESHVG